MGDSLSHLDDLLYRDNLLCLDCTDKLEASVLALLVLPLQFAE